MRILQKVGAQSLRVAVVAEFLQVEISVLKKGHVKTIYFMVRTCIFITI